MRVLFVGRDNPFNRGIALWLSEKYDLVACYFAEPDRFTFQGRLRQIRSRAHRNGWICTLDELAFHVVDRTLVRRKEPQRWQTEIPEQFRVGCKLEAPCYIVPDIHKPQWLEHVRSLSPDIIFSCCMPIIFRRSFYDIPRYGTFVLHEGLTPEYRGLHTPLWSFLRNEQQFLGYTLLQIDDSIDNGKVLVQERYYPTKDEDYHCWSLVGHKAIIYGIPRIEAALDALATQGTFTPVSCTGRKSHLFTWMRLSTFVRLLLKRLILRPGVAGGENPISSNL